MGEVSVYVISPYHVSIMRHTVHFTTVEAPNENEKLLAISAMPTIKMSARGSKGPRTPKKGHTPVVPVTPEESGAIAREMQSKRTCEGTKDTYKSKIKVACDWFKKNQPHCLAKNGSFKLPIPCKELLQFFGYLCRAAFAREKLKSADEITDEMEEPVSSSCVSGYRSAIVDIYTNANDMLAKETSLALKKVMDGYDKTLTDLKRRGLMKISEGKRPISGSGYGLLAEKFMKTHVPRTNKKVVAGSGATALFGWPFFVVMWNLMSRADSVDHIMLQHMEWNGDALIITELLVFDPTG